MGKHLFTLKGIIWLNAKKSRNFFNRAGRSLSGWWKHTGILPSLLLCFLYHNYFYIIMAAFLYSQQRCSAFFLVSALGGYSIYLIWWLSQNKVNESWTVAAPNNEQKLFLSFEIFKQKKLQPNFLNESMYYHFLSVIFIVE